MSFKDEFYKNYHSTHTAHRKGVPSIDSFRKSAPSLRKKYWKLLPRELNAKILEVGCGDGRFVWWLGQLGYTNVRGEDISAEQVAVARKLGLRNVVQQDLFATLSSTERYDVIIMRDVLEHFDRSEILTIMRLCYDALSVNGRLILHVPNAESPFFGRIRYGDFTHEIAFTMSSLSQLCNVVGFKNHKFVSDEAAVSCLRDLARLVVWKVAEAIYCFLLYGELGRGTRIVSQNIIVCTTRPAI